jgi:hypothetical protein
MKAQDVKVGDLLSGKESPYYMYRYDVLEVVEGYWDDGATGYRIQKTTDVGQSFWVRPDELEDMYQTI